MSKQEQLRADFYKNYQKEAVEYDRGFMKKYDDDLTTTLIFVSLAPVTRTHVFAKLDHRLVCFLL